jgi:hypothetical protein
MITNDLIGIWNFDNQDATDSFGSLDGTASPGVQFESADNRSYAKFNGSSHIDLGPSSNIPVDTNDFTISSWIRPTNLTATAEAIFGTVITQDTSPKYSGIHFLVNDESISLGIGGAGSYEYATYYTPASLQDSWSHVLVTRQGPEIKIYVNGVMELSQNVSSVYDISPSYATHHRYAIGSYFWTDNNWHCPFTGDIDDVRFWTRALSVQEILDLHNTTLSSISPASIAVRLRVISKGIN